MITPTRFMLMRMHTTRAERDMLYISKYADPCLVAAGEVGSKYRAEASHRTKRTTGAELSACTFPKSTLIKRIVGIIVHVMVVDDGGCVSFTGKDEHVRSAQV